MKLSVPQTATRLGVTRGRVAQYLREGRFPNATKDRWGYWLIPATDLDTLIVKASGRPKKTS